MAYNVDWLIKNKIIYAQFWGDGSSDELREALTVMTTMRRESSEEKIHTITNTTQLTIVAPFQETIKVMREFSAIDNTGWEIVVGNLNTIVSMSLKISRSLLRTKSINFKTMEEALDHLKKEDPTINWDSLDQTIINS